MKNSFLCTFFFILIYLLLPGLVSTQEAKNALLIANNDYGKDVGALDKPISEARNLKTALESIGFSVTIVENANLEKMGISLKTFKEKCKKEGGIAFFHYGGHAVQVDGINYLLPANVQLENADVLRYRCIEVNELMDSMQGRTNIVILDSCRNNPFKSSTRGGKTRGLVAVTKQPHNSIIVYSAAANNTAKDGVFTPILTKRITERNKNFYEILQEIRRDVHIATGGMQKPGAYDELMAPIYLSGIDAKESPKFEMLEMLDIPESIQKTSQKNDEKIYSVNGINFVMKFIDAVKDAVLGSDAEKDNKKHNVSLSAYYIGETEVTQALWQEVMKTNPSRYKDSLQSPVEQVTWFECVAFCNELTAQIMGEEHCVYKIDGNYIVANFSKKGFRLPTESEWEYAALAGRPYRWAGTDNETNLKDYAWYGTLKGDRPKEVKTKLPNAYGLYDMSGNVCEWCWDWYSDKKPKGKLNPITVRNKRWKDYRVSRGGPYHYSLDDTYYLSCVAKLACSSNSSFSTLGLRLVCRP